MMTALLVAMTVSVAVSLVVVMAALLKDLREGDAGFPDNVTQILQDHLALTVRRSFTVASRSRPRVLGTFIL